MQWLHNRSRRLVLAGSLVVAALGGQAARAHFTLGEPVNLGPIVNCAAFNRAPRISADGLEMYYSCSSSLEVPTGDLWGATRERVNDPWSDPVALGPSINGPLNEQDPTISADGLELYFVQGWDAPQIFVATRESKDKPWGRPLALSQLGHACEPDISSNGLELYFSSDRPSGYGRRDIWVSTRATRFDRWSEPVNLGPNVNGRYDESGPSISDDGLVLFYAWGPGMLNLRLATRATILEPWGPGVDICSNLFCPSSYDCNPSVSSDGSTLYFESGRRGGCGALDIWQVPIVPIVDFNGDESVDVRDLVILADHWGTAEKICDIGPRPWGDGVVDEADAEVLMRYWGQEFDDPTLIGHWKLDETEGLVAEDSAGEHHGILHGDPTWWPVRGVIDGALQLDGIDDCIQTSPALDPNEGPFSVFAWVLSGARGRVILSQDNGAKWLTASDDGTLATELSGRGADDLLMSQAYITDGHWHRVGLTWDGSRRTLYVDDVIVAQDIQTRLDSQGAVLYIGASGPNHRGRAATFFCGLIDDVRIYNRAVRP